MDNFLSTAIQNGGFIFSFLALFAVGGVALYGVFNQKYKDKQNEETDLEDRIRSLYKEENKVQEDKIKDLLNRVDIFEKQIEKLISENKILKDIFQGRDGQTIEFQKQGFLAMKQANEMHMLLIEQKEVSLQNRKEIEQTNKNIERLAQAIEKHLEARVEGGESSE